MTATTLDETATAAVLLDRYGEEAARRAGPIWLQVRPSAGSSATLSPDDLDVVEAEGPQGLLGRRVDPGWEGAALVGTGRLRLLDEAHEPPAALVPGFGGGLAMACVVSRRARTGWRLRLPDGTFYDRVPEEGFMLDVLRRALGLPTTPPPCSTTALDIAGWLLSLIETGGERQALLGWEQVLRLNPALGGRIWFDERQADVLLREETGALTWESLRQMVAAGLPAIGAPPPHLAAWMDEGMFARSVLRDLPSPSALLSVVRSHLEPAAYRRLRHTIHSLESRPDSV